MNVFQIEITKNYRVVEWREDLYYSPVFTDGSYTKGTRALYLTVNAFQIEITKNYRVVGWREDLYSPVFTDASYSKGTRAHTHRELIYSHSISL